MGTAVQDDETQTTDDTLAGALDEATDGPADHDMVMTVGGDVRSIAEGMKAARREALKERAPLYLEVPGFKGQLVGRYGVVDWPILKRITEQVTKSKDDYRELKGQAAVIGVACTELFGVVPKGTTGAEFIADLGKHVLPMSAICGVAHPVRFDSTLGEFYGFDVASTTEGVLNAIAPVTAKGERENAFQLTMHHNEVMLWIGEEQDEADEDFLGESRAAGR